MPTAALFFMQASNLLRFRWTHAASADRGDVPLWKVTYEEITRPTIIRTSAGRDMPLKGHVWVSPGDGRVFETELLIESSAMQFVPRGKEPGLADGQAGEFKRVPSRARITVTYQADLRLGLLLPDEMREFYERVRGESVRADRYADVATATECRATYSDFKRFETAMKLVIPK